MQILLTGGHTGIGLELSKMLLNDGHSLGLIVRSEKRTQEAIQALGSSEKIDFFYADLSKSEEVTKVTLEVSEKWTRIDGIFNNAGVLLDQAYYSDRGNEMHLEVNTLAPYALTLGLKGLLDKSDNPFVVNTVTGGMANKKSIDIPDLKKPKKFVKLFGSYMNSKMALTLLMNDLAAKWPQVRILNVDPGPNKTNMTGGSGVPVLVKIFGGLVFTSPTKGGKKLYDAAFDDKFAGKSGVYISGNSMKEVRFSLTETEIQEMVG